MSGQNNNPGITGVSVLEAVLDESMIDAEAACQLEVRGAHCQRPAAWRLKIGHEGHVRHYLTCQPCRRRVRSYEWACQEHGDVTMTATWLAL